MQASIYSITLSGCFTIPSENKRNLEIKYQNSRAQWATSQKRTSEKLRVYFMYTCASRADTPEPVIARQGESLDDRIETTLAWKLARRTSAGRFSLCLWNWCFMIQFGRGRCPAFIPELLFCDYMNFVYSYVPWAGQWASPLILLGVYGVIVVAVQINSS